MYQKSLFIILSFMICAGTVKAAEYADQMGNAFGAGTADGLSSGNFAGGAGDGAGGDSTVMGRLKGEGISLYIGAGLGLNMIKTPLHTTQGYPAATPKSVGYTKNINTKMPGFSFTIGGQQKGDILTDFGVMAMYMPEIIKKNTPGRSGITAKNTLQEKYRFSVYGGSGVAITPAVNLFGKLGVVYSAFDIGYKETSTLYKGNQSINALGVAPGVMLQYKISETLSTNLDISYIIYKAIKTKNLAATNGPTGYEYKTKINPRILTVMVGGAVKLGAGS